MTIFSKTMIYHGTYPLRLSFSIFKNSMMHLMIFIQSMTGISWCSNMKQIYIKPYVVKIYPKENNFKAASFNIKMPKIKL